MNPGCDICGHPDAVPCVTGTHYCAEHEPGVILLPSEWGMLSLEQQQRRERANEAISANPPGSIPGDPLADYGPTGTPPLPPAETE
jgi:hypothetical protein